MNNMYYFFFFMFIFFMILFIYSLMLYYMDLSMLLEWMLMSFNSINIELILLIDWISLMFISVVLLISSMIILYSIEYMFNDKFMLRFFWLLMMFVFSMILMILSPNIISILFGWDGLGVVSYCLVIYYQNYISYNSGMITVLCNRVGDVGLLMCIGLLFLEGSWNLISFVENKLMAFMLLIAVITKSAQIPFSSWLPAAMAAPTPVSALVHSSTLVTAGVYMVIRFNSVFLDNKINFMLLFMSIVTMFMSGLMAVVEVDLKKIIALSTLSQLGLMMMILSLGFPLMGFCHLIIHAIFKSLLFMCAGIIIHSMFNSQDIRFLGNLSEVFPFTMMMFLISSLALSGFPFLAGFYSKDLIMEMIYVLKMNFFMMIFILMSLSFTVMYSFRLYYYLFFSDMKFYSYMVVKENFLMNFSMLMLSFSSIVVGSIIMWLFFFDSYLIFLSYKLKSLTLLLCLMGVLLVKMIMFYVFKKLYYLIYFISSMWFLNNFYSWIYKPMNFFSGKIESTDKIWLEFMKVDLFKYLNKYMKFNFNYKIYMFVYVYIYITVMFLMFF